jgi:hypothetical protein
MVCPYRMLRLEAEPQLACASVRLKAVRPSGKGQAP